jgi:hypothetical protein
MEVAVHLEVHLEVHLVHQEPWNSVVTTNLACHRDVLPALTSEGVLSDKQIHTLHDLVSSMAHLLWDT